MRASGDPYFSHPVEVAGLLAQMKLDTASIITGLLHDTVEDTVATLDDIERLFGAEITRLVDGVTKLSRIELQSDQTDQAGGELPQAGAGDVGRHPGPAGQAGRPAAQHADAAFPQDPDKRRRIARETMDIYVPLAERIGMHRMKDQLEDLAFAELHPDARDSIIARLVSCATAGGLVAASRELSER